MEILLKLLTFSVQIFMKMPKVIPVFITYQ